MENPQIGRIYRYIFALIITWLMVIQSIRVEIDFPKDQLPQVKSFKIEETPEALAIAEISLVSYLLGLNVLGILGSKNKK